MRATNAAAIALYRAVGMTPLHELYVLRFERAVAERFAATGRHEVVLCEPEMDRAIEARLDLGAGQIQRWRSIRAEQPIYRIGETALVQVQNDLLLDQGLLFPFRAPDADTAAHLIAMAAPFPSHLELQTCDVLAAEALIAAGAVIHELQLEMGAPL